MSKQNKAVNAQEDKLIESRVSDAFEAAAKYSIKFVGFLDPHEAKLSQNRARNICRDAAYSDCSYMFYGGYNGAERVFLGVFPPYAKAKDDDFPINAIDITWRFKSLSHRDFLGALLSLGISRGKIGDIIVGDGKCTVFAEKAVAFFIVQNLVKVGTAGVACHISDGEFAVRDEQFAQISGTVASQRLDCVVAALTGRTRSAAAELITGGLVTVDFEICCDVSGTVNENKTVSIRSHGRYIIDRLGPQTKKGRLSFAARKYL